MEEEDFDPLNKRKGSREGGREYFGDGQLVLVRCCCCYLAIY